MIDENATCPFCYSTDATKRSDRVKMKINGLTIKLLPHKKWFCPNCKRYFRNPAINSSAEFINDCGYQHEMCPACGEPKNGLPADPTKDFVKNV